MKFSSWLVQVNRVSSGVVFERLATVLEDSQAFELELLLIAFMRKKALYGQAGNPNTSQVRAVGRVT